MPRHAILRALAIATAAAGLAGAASAQTSTAPTGPVQQQPRDPNMPAPQSTVPEKVDSTGSTRTLSDKLERSDGVIKPPSNVDPGMAVKTPAPDSGTMPVIPPPGSPGGNPNVRAEIAQMDRIAPPSTRIEAPVT